MMILWVLYYILLLLVNIEYIIKIEETEDNIMTKEEKYSHWEELAIYDLESAEIMLKSGRYMYVAFMCQQAIEKLAKALHVLYLDKEAPKTHNIVTVMNLVFEGTTDDGIKNSICKYKEYKPFMIELLTYYISERYVEYKSKINQTLNQQVCNEIISKTKEVFTWLQSLKNF